MVLGRPLQTGMVQAACALITEGSKLPAVDGANPRAAQGGELGLHSVPASWCYGAKLP